MIDLRDPINLNSNRVAIELHFGGVLVQRGISGTFASGETGQ